MSMTRASGEQYLSSRLTPLVKICPCGWSLLLLIAVRNGAWGPTLFLSLGLVVLLPMLWLKTVLLSSDGSELIVRSLFGSESIPLHRIRRVSGDGRDERRPSVVKVTLAPPSDRRITFMPAVGWTGTSDIVNDLRYLAEQAGAVLDEPAGPASTRLLSGL